MLTPMGFGRKIVLSAVACALPGSAASAAAGAREPLTITKLQDPEASLELSSGADQKAGEAAFDPEIFGRAVAESIRRQKRSTDAICRKSATRAAGTMSARWAWAASCLYQRY